MKKIKLHYFSVDKVGKPKDLEEVLALLQKKDISERTLNCNYVKVRLDHVELIEVPTPHWALRFSRLREDNWPAVSSLVEASKDLELDEDTFLSEETYVLYDPSKHRMVIQYNHVGVRPGKVQEYLTQCVDYSDGGYRLLPVLTDDALMKYQQKQIVTAVDVFIDDLTPQDLAYFEGSSLVGAIQTAIEGEGSKVKMTFSVDARVKKKRLKHGLVDDIVNRVLRRNGDNDKISVQAKEDEDDAVEVLNLLESRKGVEYDADSIPRTSGRRYEPDHMFKLLNQALREWDKK